MGQKKKAKSAKHKQGGKKSPAKAAKILDHVQQAKEKGNDAMRERDFKAAVAAYSQGIDEAAKIIASNKEEEVSILTMQLYSNRAQALLKLNDFEKAEADCSRAIEIEGVNTPTKVWYRRALAREGKVRMLLAKENGSATAVVAADAGHVVAPQQNGGGHENGEEESTSSTQQKQKELLTDSIRDLEEGMEALSLETNPTSTAKIRRTVTVLMERLQKALRRFDMMNLPTPEKQKETVLLLLKNRSDCAQKQVVMKGEAFFLLEWKWWCEWCQYVGMANEETLLPYLLPGAAAPQLDDENDDEDSSGDEDEEEEVYPPGPVDNTRLILELPDKVEPDTPSLQVFWMDWYQEPPTTEETTDGKDEDPTPLRPNLVRGYHYEMLPREVYAALVSWYGEVTPSVCRRVDEEQLSLYSEFPLNSYIIPTPPGLGQCSACRTMRATSRCQRCMTARYCNRLCQESHWPQHKQGCKHPRHQSSKEGGRVGLNNLGNTCFMNAALQSLSQATPLTRHFLSGRFKVDLNPGNPLGTGGKLAHAYHTVLKDLWWSDKRSTSPTALKRAIALFAPRFAGCIQHDTQEFLAYLLDGLHEDLNRIRKAPYVEMPDVTDGQNMAVAGARAWEAHCRRNDSLVMDTFYGQFKSTCVCPLCKRVSVSFDAFNHVSLEIPQAKNAIVPITVLVFPSRSTKPVHYGLEIRRNSPIKDLCLGLGHLSGIDPERLALCEVFDGTITDILKTNEPVSEIRQEDFIVAYEVDKFTNDKFHVLASHKVVFKDPPDEEEEEGDLDLKSKYFGYPFMASFSADFSCREIADYIWSRMAHVVADTNGDEIYSRSQLRILLHDGRGNLRGVFPASPEPEVTTKTAQLPHDSEVKLVDILGKGATEQFLSIYLEWSDEPWAGSETETVETTGKIDEENFLACETHSSFLEVDKRKEAMSAAKSAVTLDQCFEAFTKPERLDENNKWYCSNCKEHVQALKTMELWRLPNILVVHLKRFEFKHILRRVKLDTLVDFPLEGMDMNKHCASNSAASNSGGVVKDFVPADYDLFAVTNHFGRMGSGHYTAFARSWDEYSGLSQEWLRFDDSHVHAVPNPKETIVSPAAYVLFYRRKVFH